MEDIDVQLTDAQGRPLPAEGRYDRLELIPWWDRGRMASARVLVVGAGALGNEIVKNLALLGVGRVMIIDLDRIELSNLTRSVLFREADIGKPKADVAAERAMEINPHIQVRGVVGNVVSDLGLGVYREMDLVLGGLDNREARLAINQACWKVGIPFVDGAIEVFFGVARVFQPPDSACFECTMNETDLMLLNKRKSCALLSREEMASGKVPTTPTVSSVIAGVQVSEAMKLLHARRDLPTLSGAGFFFNGLTHDSYVIRYERKEDCISHDRYEHVVELDRSVGSTTLAEMLERARREVHADAVLDLEKELVVKVVCDRCRRETPVRRVLGQVREEVAQCPGCGRLMRPELTHTIDAGCEFLDSTLAQVGVPAYDVVTGRHGLKRRHYLFAADREAALGTLA